MLLKSMQKNKTKDLFLKNAPKHSYAKKSVYKIPTMYIQNMQTMWMIWSCFSFQSLTF